MTLYISSSTVWEDDFENLNVALIYLSPAGLYSHI
jgi:hypothetical protein